MQRAVRTEGKMPLIIMFPEQGVAIHGQPSTGVTRGMRARVLYIEET